MKSARLWVVAASLAMAALAAGALVGVVIADDEAELDSMRAGLDALSSRAASLETSLARVRAERNRLEARLAARRDAPVCPAETVSTADAGLPLSFSVDYPCGWHVVHDALDRIDAPGREGLSVAVTLFAQLPVALVPRAGTLADIELSDWSDDPGDDEDALPSKAAWLEEERERFEDQPEEERFEGARGATIHRLAGSILVDDVPVEVVVLVWEFTDPLSGARHIARAFAEAPGPRVASALESIARSFVVIER